jgi:hypothetical protein
MTKVAVSPQLLVAARGRMLVAADEHPRRRNCNVKMDSFRTERPVQPCNSQQSRASHCNQYLDWTRTSRCPVAVGTELDMAGDVGHDSSALGARGVSEDVKGTCSDVSGCEQSSDA